MQTEGGESNVYPYSPINSNDHVYNLKLTSSGSNSQAYCRVSLALCDLSKKYPLAVSLLWAGGLQLLYEN